MTVQAAERPAEVDAAVRVGFTLTRKVGNAVVRNRCRRRLKEAVRLSGDLPVVAGHDYVIVGRVAAANLPFTTLQRELEAAVRGVHAPERGGSRTTARDARGPKRTRREP